MPVMSHLNQKPNNARVPRSSAKAGAARKVFIGGYVSQDLKNQLQAIADRERRSLNAQLEIFLAKGVTHRKAS